MGLMPRQVSVPEQEVTPTKIPYKNLASVASHDDGAQLNFYYEQRSDMGIQTTNGEPCVFVKKREGITAHTSVLAGASTQVGRGSAAWRPSSVTTDFNLVALDDGTDTCLYLDVAGVLTLCKNGATTIKLTKNKDVYFVPVSTFDGTTTTQGLRWNLSGVDLDWSLSNYGLEPNILHSTNGSSKRSDVQRDARID
jgi:hypothetical protein